MKADSRKAGFGRLHLTTLGTTHPSDERLRKLLPRKLEDLRADEIVYFLALSGWDVKISKPCEKTLLARQRLHTLRTNSLLRRKR